MNIMADSSIENVSIKALRKDTLQTISQLLNPTKIIPTESGLPRDWQGLAELVKVGGEHLPYLHNDPDPTCQILHLWHKKNEKESTVGNLISYLEQLDRFDIVDDIAQLISDDINWYKENGNKCEPDPIDLDIDKHILTRDDVSRISQGLPLQNYDAFVLFADEDVGFATDLIDTMEKQYNMKLCVKHRDLVGGSFEHEVIIKLISERCNRLIVIMSSTFFNSPANQFFCVYAQALGIEQRQRKIIPCLFGSCEIPPEFKYYYPLRYNRSLELYNFWDKLYDSLRTPTPSRNKNYQNGLSAMQEKSVTQQTLKPALHNGNSLSSTKKESVKFRSMVDVNKIDSEILPDPHLNTSSSLNAISNEPKKVKTKNGWLNKILHKSDKSASNGIGEKRKKRLWPIKKKLVADN